MSEALGNELPPEFSRKQVITALEALYSYVDKVAHADALGLLDEKHKLNLQLTFKKVPNIKSKVIRVGLPHGLSQENANICLFVKDIDKSERDYTPTVRHFKELLAGKGVKNISEILPMKAVKTEYQPFEAKRNLSNAYDVFLADERIIRLLPGFLGKHFYQRKRLPLPVNLKATDLQKEINRALKTTQCALGGVGSTCQVTVSHTGLSPEQSAENIMAAMHTLCKDIPGGALNIRSLYIKTIDSPALPIYANTDSAVNVVLPPRSKRPALDEPEELSTLMEGKVRVSRHGNIQIIKELVEGEEKNNNKQTKPKKQEPKKKAAKAQKTTEPEVTEPTPKKAKQMKKGIIKKEKPIVKEESDSEDDDEDRSDVEVETSSNDDKDSSNDDKDISNEEETPSPPKVHLGKRRVSGTSVDQWMKKAKAKELTKPKPISKRLKKK